MWISYLHFRKHADRLIFDNFDTLNGALYLHMSTHQKHDKNKQDLAGLSIRGGTMYFYPPKRVIGTS
jgi:hypothetical protein